MTDTQYALLYSVSPANAHTALFNEYFNYVYSIVFNKLRSCGTKEDIEECVSDVFAAVFEKYEKNGFSSGSLNGLIGTIAANKAISYFRSLSAKSKYTAEIDETALSEISDDELKKRLLDFRVARAKELNYPAYYVFNNEELDKLVELRPKSLEELKNSNILAPIKVKTHGELIIQIVNNK